jgi:hypothetical protein
VPREEPAVNPAPAPVVSSAQFDPPEVIGSAAASLIRRSS